MTLLLQDVDRARQLLLHPNIVGHTISINQPKMESHMLMKHAEMEGKNSMVAIGEHSKLFKSLFATVEEDDTPSDVDIARLQLEDQQSSVEVETVARVLDAIAKHHALIHHGMNLPVLFAECHKHVICADANTRKQMVHDILYHLFGLERSWFHSLLYVPRHYVMNDENMSQLLRYLEGFAKMGTTDGCKILHETMFVRLPRDIRAAVFDQVQKTREQLTHMFLAQKGDAESRLIRKHIRLSLAMAIDISFLATESYTGLRNTIVPRLRCRTRMLRALELRAQGPASSNDNVTLNTLVVCNRSTFRKLRRFASQSTTSTPRIRRIEYNADIHTGLDSEIVCISQSGMSSLSRFTFKRVVVLPGQWSMRNNCISCQHLWFFKQSLYLPIVERPLFDMSCFFGWTNGGPHLTELQDHVIVV